MGKRLGEDEPLEEHVLALEPWEGARVETEDSVVRAEPEESLDAVRVEPEKSAFKSLVPSSAFKGGNLAQLRCPLHFFNPTGRLWSISLALGKSK